MLDPTRNSCKKGNFSSTCMRPCFNAYTFSFVNFHLQDPSTTYISVNTPQHLQKILYSTSIGQRTREYTVANHKRPINVPSPIIPREGGDVGQTVALALKIFPSLPVFPPKSGVVSNHGQWNTLDNVQVKTGI